MGRNVTRSLYVRMEGYGSSRNPLGAAAGYQKVGDRRASRRPPALPPTVGRRKRIDFEEVTVWEVVPAPRDNLPCRRKNHAGPAFERDGLEPLEDTRSGKERLAFAVVVGAAIAGRLSWALELVAADHQQQR